MNKRLMATGFYRYTAFLAGLVFFTGLFAADDADAPPANLDELKTAVAEVMTRFRVPAAGIAMVDQNGPVWVEALGKADRERNIDADNQTLFRIGSVSKLFAGLAALKLVEEGRLSLDDKVADLVADVESHNPWEDSHPVRVVHLLEHTTGWDDIHLVEFAHNDPTPISLKDALDFHPHSRTSRWAPGSRMAYCNVGPAVLAYIVETLTGQPYEDYIQDTFFDPMGMETMTYLYTDAVRDHGATLYTPRGPVPYWHILVRPAGSINANVNDLARMLQLFLGRGRVNGRQIISPAAIDRMEIPMSTDGARAGMPWGYGLGNFTTYYKGLPYRGHNGGVTGGVTNFFYQPELGVGHAISINSGNGAALNAMTTLIRDYETRDIEAPEIANDVPMTAAHEAVAGFYRPINPRTENSRFMLQLLNNQHLSIEGDRLKRETVGPGPGAYLLPARNGRFKSGLTGEVSLVATTDPVAGEVLHMGNVVLEPISPLRAYCQLAVLFAWLFLAGTSLAFFPVWGIRRLKHKIPPGPAIQVRLWPLLATAAIGLMVILGILASRDTFANLGKPTLYSVGIMGLSIAFALLAVAGCYAAWVTRQATINRVAYWHSTLTSIMHLLVAVYLAGYGMIGYMTWA